MDDGNVGKDGARRAVSTDPAEQRRFYEGGEHAHLQARIDDAYVSKLAGEVARASSLGACDRALEIGAGFGRFTFALLESCASVVAVDLAPRSLAILEATRDARGIAATRCTTRCLDVTTIGPDSVGEHFRVLVGFFVLHHLPDLARVLPRLAELLRPGGEMVFIEPNRWNPLYLAQIATCPDMSWAAEKELFRLSAPKVEDAFYAAGLEPVETRRFGFFPPPVFNRIAAARALEARLELQRWLQPVLPFLLLRARRPGTS